MDQISMEQYNLLKTKHERLVDLVRRMRGNQKEYFKYRDKQTLERSKTVERQVDAMIIAEVKEQQSKQPNLF